MSRSIVMPLLALCGIILYGTTQASQPTPETLMGMESDRIEIGPDRAEFDQAAGPRPSTPPSPPPAPRLRSNEEAEEAAPEPEPRDSAAAADRVVPSEGTVPVTTSSSRYDATGHPVEADSDDRWK